MSVQLTFKHNYNNSIYYYYYYYLIHTHRMYNAFAKNKHTNIQKYTHLA